MFSGIINELGEILQVAKKAEGLRRVTIKCGYDPNKIAIGASIACSGICLTVVARGRTRQRRFFGVDVAWRSGTQLNLERSLRLGDELGGHLVSGHVDGIAKLVARKDLPDMAQMSFRVPGKLSRFIASKGSVALDGVSLTVNEVKGDTFSVLIIPHTLKVTTFGALQNGARLNLEVDQMARYAARLLATAPQR